MCDQAGIRSDLSQGIKILLRSLGINGIQRAEASGVQQFGRILVTLQRYV